MRDYKPTCPIDGKAVLPPLLYEFRSSNRIVETEEFTVQVRFPINTVIAFFLSCLQCKHNEG